MGAAGDVPAEAAGPAGVSSIAPIPGPGVTVARSSISRGARVESLRGAVPYADENRTSALGTRGSVLTPSSAKRPHALSSVPAYENRSRYGRPVAPTAN